jgi:hypothetical protein
MKLTDLFEQKLQMGKYSVPYSWPNRSHRGLERIYNYVWPELAQALVVPARNVKFKGWSTENASFFIRISNPKTEVDMLEIMAPRALKHLLDKVGLQDVVVTHVSTINDKPTKTGRVFPTIQLDFTSSYPQRWIELDKETYGNR